MSNNNTQPVNKRKAPTDTPPASAPLNKQIKTAESDGGGLRFNLKVHPQIAGDWSDGSKLMVVITDSESQRLRPNQTSGGFVYSNQNMYVTGGM